VRDESYSFLCDLLVTPSLTGYEEPAQRVVAQYAKAFGASVQTDAHANLIAGDGREARPRVMLTGHVDQVGLMVRYISDEGYLVPTFVGGTQLQESQRVLVHTASGPRLGVVGKKPLQHSKPEDRGRALEPFEYWVDIGAASGEEARKAVRIGDPITWTVPVERLGEELLVSAALDDKIGVFTAIEALRRLMEEDASYAGTVCALSAVQEEIGCVGAGVAAFAWEPDAAVAVDVWPMVTDVPDTDKRRFGEMKLGAGPVLIRGANVNTVLLEELIAAAEAERIPYQLCGWPGMTPTDAQSIYRAGRGVATALIGLPQRYLHTPSEMVHLADVENTIRLMVALCRRLTTETDFTQRARITG
jgi:tetrahedral aminopeptidase